MNEKVSFNADGASTISFVRNYERLQAGKFEQDPSDSFVPFDDTDKLVAMCGAIAKDSGWDVEREGMVLDSAEHHAWVNTKLMLIVSELVEAMEELRNGHTVNEVYSGDSGKPEGFLIELADAVIRIFHLWDLEASHNPEGGFSMERIIMAKLFYNSTRGNRHGGKKF